MYLLIDLSEQKLFRMFNKRLHNIPPEQTNKQNARRTNKFMNENIYVDLWCCFDLYYLERDTKMTAIYISYYQLHISLPMGTPTQTLIRQLNGLTTPFLFISN